MIVRKSEVRSRLQPDKKRIASAVQFAIICLLLLFSLQTFSFGAEAEKWQGIDDAVVKKIAKEHGRDAKEPLINTDQGDLLLFVFLLAGAVGGFAAGYCWRRLMEGRGRDSEVGARKDGTVC